MKKIIITTLFITLLTLSAFAVDNDPTWDGIVTCHITTLGCTRGGNYGFRVFTDAPDLLNDTNTSHKNITWAYLNDTDSNYKTYVALLTTAFTMGYKVRLHVVEKTFQPTNEVYLAHIGHITIIK